MYDNDTQNADTTLAWFRKTKKFRTKENINKKKVKKKGKTKRTKKKKKEKNCEEVKNKGISSFSSQEKARLYICARHCALLIEDYIIYKYILWDVINFSACPWDLKMNKGREKGRTRKKISIYISRSHKRKVKEGKKERKKEWKKGDDSLRNNVYNL